MIIYKQDPLFATMQPSHNQRVVNVASVKQLSPFRYPGGKTWFIPHLKLWLSSRNRPAEFVEPFAGGGIVSCTILYENLADHVTMVELDRGVVAVWETIFSEHAEALAERILTFKLDLDSVIAELSKPGESHLDMAFQTILRNRVNRGGIMAAGSGLIKAGENGKGLLSRWYPDTLAKRIRNLSPLQDRVTVIHGDGISALRQQANNPNATAFIDPPYTAGGKRAGSRLYNHFELDHEGLFSVAESFMGDFVMTYDNAQEVRALAERHGFDTQLISMKNTHHTVMSELLIGRTLDWARL